MQAVLALLMLVGYGTRAVTITSYVLLCSLQNRNPLLMFGVDIALRVCFFWAMFLPLNRRFALDVALGRVRRPENDTYFRIPGIAYVIQFAAIYVFSSLLKTGPTWQIERTAVYYALATEFLQRSPGAWLNQHDTLTRWMTVATLHLEKYGPLFFVSPVWSGWLRLIAFAAFAVFQVGINVTMWMGLFGAVMIGVMTALLPAEFWTHIAEPAGRRLVRFLGRIRGSAKEPPWTADAITRWRRRALALGRALCDGMALLLIMYVVVWNINTVPGRQGIMPRTYTWIAVDTGLHQLFNFFAPDPGTDDGWLVIEGDLENGKTVNAFTGEPTVSFEKPVRVSDAYVDQRWSAYLLCITSAGCSQHLQPFSEYLGRKWNRVHSGPERMATIRITYMHEYVGPDHTRQPATPELLWTQTF